MFIYKKAYLRICGAHFDLSQFDDQQRHISNYSVQKDADLVLSSDDFIAFLRRTNPDKYKDLTWEGHFLPQVDFAAKAALLQSADVIDNRPNSFELFGFDFVVDKDLKLWLIEVNMSPACSERQPWLKEMLDDMADGVTNMIAAKVQAHRSAQEHVARRAGLAATDGSQQITSELHGKQSLYNKLQKQMLARAIEGTQWAPMSKVDSFFLNSDSKSVKVKVPQSQVVHSVNP